MSQFKFRSKKKQFINVVVGVCDFSEDDRDKLKKYLNVNLELNNNLAEQTTFSGSCINVTFSRYIYLIC